MLPLTDRNPTARTPVVTVLLILANFGVFLFWQGGGTLGAREETAFSLRHAAIPCELTTGHPITDVELQSGKCFDKQQVFERQLVPDKNVYVAALVSMFLHGGWIHLLGNMLFLWIFGNNIEDKLGSVLFLGFYLAGGVV